MCPVDSALSSIKCVCLCAIVCLCVYMYLYELPENMEYNKVFLAYPRLSSFFEGIHHTQSVAGG